MYVFVCVHPKNIYIKHACRTLPLDNVSKLSLWDSCCTVLICCLFIIVYILCIFYFSVPFYKPKNILFVILCLLTYWSFCCYLFVWLMFHCFICWVFYYISVFYFLIYLNYLVVCCTIFCFFSFFFYIIVFFPFIIL